MAYRKYYTLETVSGTQLLSCDSADINDALNALIEERDNPDNNIPQNSLIYSYDIDETAAEGQRIINKTLVS